MFLKVALLQALIRIATVWKNGVGRKVGPFFYQATTWTSAPCNTTPR